MSNPSARYVDRSSAEYRRDLAQRRLQEVLEDPDTLAQVAKTWQNIEAGTTGEPTDWDQLRATLDPD